MGVSRDRASAALKKAYCLATGVNLRTAQRHAKDNHPDWQKFLGTQAIAAVNMKEGQGRSPEQVAALATMSPVVPKAGDAPVNILPPPGHSDILDSDLSGPEMMERQQWALWVESSRSWENSLKDNDPQMSMAYAAITLKAREAYIKAQNDREAWEISQRRLVSIAEWHAVHQNFVVPVASLLSNIEAELCALVNPDDPDYARGKLQEWKLDKLQPRLDLLIRELEAA